MKVIYACFPQAKGRVERLFGILQDRVIKEMRFAGAKNRDEGNEFLKTCLPKYHRQFGVASAKEADLHRPFKGKKQQDRILSIRNKRALRNDFTAAHNKKRCQITDNIRMNTVMVEERTEGSMRIILNDQRLKYKEIKSRPMQELKKPLLSRAWTGTKPAADHPWKVIRAINQEKRRSYPQRLKIGHFCFGKNTTFPLGVDKRQ